MLDRNASIRIINDDHVLAGEGAGDLIGVEHEQNFVVLHRQIVRQRPLFFPSENSRQCRQLVDGPMRILIGFGEFAEPRIVARQKRRQERVAAFDVNDVRKPQLLNEPVLQCPESTFHAALACGVLAQMISMLSSSSARPNWVMPVPPAASRLFTRKMECLSE